MRVTGKVMRQRARLMREVRRTPAEISAEAILARLGIPARCQIVIGKRYIADFIGYDRAFVLELDGPIHEKQRAYDAQRDLLFRSAGFTVLRVKNEDLCEDILLPLLSLPVQTRQRINSMIWYAKTLSKYPPQQWSSLSIPLVDNS